MYQSIEEQHHFEAQEAREREEREAQEQKRAEAERADRERGERARAERERDERADRDRAERERADKDRAERDAKDRERADRERQERKEAKRERDNEPAPQRQEEERRAEQEQSHGREPERHPSKPQNVETNLRRGLLDGRIAAAVASRGDVTPTVTMEREREQKLEPSKAKWTKDYEITQDAEGVSYSRDGEEKIRDEGRVIKTASDERSIKDGVSLALERSKESDKKFHIDAKDPEKRAAIWKEVVRQNGQDRVAIRQHEWKEFSDAVHDVTREKYALEKAEREEQQHENEAEEEHEHGD